MLLIIDNYDSFTFNLVHYFQELRRKNNLLNYIHLRTSCMQ